MIKKFAAFLLVFTLALTSGSFVPMEEAVRNFKQTIDLPEQKQEGLEVSSDTSKENAPTLEDVKKESIYTLNKNKGDYAKDRIILNIGKKEDAYKAAKDIGVGKEKVRISADDKYAVIDMPKGTTVEKFINENPQYSTSVTPDYYVRLSTITPSIPAYTYQDKYYSSQDNLNYINIGESWNKTKGAGVTVAVIDTGIDTDNPEFAGRISKKSYNASEDKVGIQYVEDEQGHGTAVAGVLAAGADNGGIVGIAPEANILVIKCKATTNGQFVRSSDLVLGLSYAIEQDVDVVNMSFGTTDPINLLEHYTQLAADSDIICVAAAGNDSTSSLTWPAADPNVIGVGALDVTSGELASYSNYGENSDIVAPGTAFTTQIGGEYAYKKGTSIACPIAAGAIALYKAVNPNCEFKDVKEMLVASSHDLGTKGEDWFYGYGELDMSALICEPVGTITFNTMTDEVTNITHKFVVNHTLQYMPEPERNYVVFNDWFFDTSYTDAVNWYDEVFTKDITLYANWINEDDGLAFSYTSLSDGTAEILSYNGKRKYITVPSQIGGLTVSSIGDSAFAGNTRIRTVTLPASLTKILDRAFSGCTNLSEIIIPNKVKSIGTDSFRDCVRLNVADIPESGALETIGSGAFANCGSLSRMNIPKNLNKLASDAFYGCSSMKLVNVSSYNTTFKIINKAIYTYSGSKLIYYPAGLSEDYIIKEGTISVEGYAFAFSRATKISIPATVTTLGNNSFENSSLISVSIPKNTVNMGSAVFKNCNMLESVTFADGMTISSIPGEMFFCCSSLTAISIPNRVTKIDTKAFAFCTSLNEVNLNNKIEDIGEYAFEFSGISQLTFPVTLKSIGEGAFLNNARLSKVIIPSNSTLQKIGEIAFDGCMKLVDFKIPAGIKVIEVRAFEDTAISSATIPASLIECTGAFAGCTELKSITADSANLTYKSMDGVLFDKKGTTLVAMPGGRTDEYIIPDGVVTIKEYAFYQSGLKNVVFCEGITTIENFAFTLSNITELLLPNSLTEIGEGSFAYCRAIPEVVIPAKVENIGYYAFSEASSLSSIYFAEGSKLKRLSYGTFANTSITMITIPANVESISSAFLGCNNLTKVEFASGFRAEYIPANLFDGANNLETITFHENNIKIIEARAFENLNALKSINLSKLEKLETIDNYCFSGCSSLSDITIPKNVSSIGRYAFSDCTSLSKIILPSKIDFIGRYAFGGTNNIEVYFVNSVLPTNLQDNWDYGMKGYYLGTSQPIKSGVWTYVTLSDGTICVISYTGKSSSLVIDKIDGKEVSAIGAEVFKDNKTIKSIVLPATLTAIYNYAFYNTTSLTEITIPDKVIFLGNYAFSNSAVNKVRLSANSKLTSIGKYAFYSTTNLSDFYVPEGVKSINENTFALSGISKVSFSEDSSLETIKKSSFDGSKLKTIVLPKKLSKIESRAFAQTDRLETVTIGNQANLEIGPNAFYGSGIKNIGIPANVTSIGEFCFSFCTNLQTINVSPDNGVYSSKDGILFSKNKSRLITYPAGKVGAYTISSEVSSIGFGAFETARITALNFASGSTVSTIGYRAFYGCDNLKTATLPDSLLSIDFYAFAACKSLSTVNISDNSKLSGIYEGAFYNDAMLKKINIPDGVKEISDYAFANCSELSTADISDKSMLFNIGSYAFSDSGLTNIVIPSSLKEIGSYAFANLTKNQTKEVIIPNSASEIGQGMLKNISAIQKLSIPYVGEFLGDNANNNIGWIFGVEMNINSTTPIPASLTTIKLTDPKNEHSGLFYGCDNLATVILPEGMTTIDGEAFRNCSKLSSINLPTSLMYINGMAFSYAGLTGTVQLPENVVSIGDSSFSFTRIEKIYIPASVTKIERGAFYRSGQIKNITVSTKNTSYKSIDGVLLTKDGKALILYPPALRGSYIVPNGVNKIVNNAFGSSNLEKITLPETLVMIEPSAFMYANLKGDVYIPKNVTSIGGDSFWECPNISTFTVSDQNKVYKSQKGILYNRDLTKLITVPTKYSGELIFPNTLKDLNGFEFRLIDGITALKMPEGATSFGGASFCGNLKYMILPDSLTSCNLFANSCNNLRCVIAGSNLSNLDGVSLDLMVSSNLNPTVYFRSNHLPSGLTDYPLVNSNYRLNAKELIETKDAILVKMNDGTASLVQYKGNATTLDISALYSGGISYIQNYAFNECTNLKKVIIPSSVKQTGEFAFQGCSSLEIVDVTKNKKFVNDKGIVYSDNGKEIVFVEKTFNGQVSLLKTLTHIPKDVFVNSKFYKNQYNWNNGCLYLDNCLIEANNPKGKGFILDGTRLIGDYAVKSFKGIEIVIPDSVCNIGLGCLYGAPEYQLHKLTLPFAGSSKENPKYDYLYYLFGKMKLSPYMSGGESSDTTLAEVVITGGNNIPNYFFNNKDFLKSVVIKGSDIKTIGAGAFRNTAIETLTIPDTVKTIGDKAFYYSKVKLLIFGKTTYVSNLSYNLNLKKIVMPYARSRMEKVLEDFSSEEMNSNKVDLFLYEDKNEVDMTELDNPNINYYFGGEWYMVKYYADGELISQEPLAANSALHAPTGVKKESDESYNYTFLGWDINGDQKVDTLPAVLTSDMVAKAVFDKKLIVKLKEISIKEKPKKLIYSIGDKFDASGLILIGSYNDGTNAVLKDYTITGFNSGKVGKQMITIKSQELTVTYEITILKPITNMNAVLSASAYGYDGLAKTPAVTITGLTSGTDYTISYSANINPGTATVTIKGKGNYTGTIIKTFKIHKGDMAGITTYNLTITYDGKAYTGDVKIPKGATITYSTNGTKYSSSKPSFVNAGIYKLYYKVIKVNYNDKVGYVTVKINAKPINGFTASLSETKYTYSGTERKPSVTVKNGTKILKVNTDYTLTYIHNTAIGKATLLIKGKGNYNGTISKTFSIVPKATKISLSTASTRYTVHPGQNLSKKFLRV